MGERKEFARYEAYLIVLILLHRILLHRIKKRYFSLLLKYLANFPPKIWILPVLSLQSPFVCQLVTTRDAETVDSSAFRFR